MFRRSPASSAVLPVVRLVDTYVEFGRQRAFFYLSALEQAFSDFTLLRLPQPRPQDCSLSKNALFGEVGLGNAPRLLWKL
jgi:hypothetical protein